MSALMPRPGKRLHDRNVRHTPVAMACTPTMSDTITMPSAPFVRGRTPRQAKNTQHQGLLHCRSTRYPLRYPRMVRLTSRDMMGSGITMRPNMKGPRNVAKTREQSHPALSP